MLTKNGDRGYYEVARVRFFLFLDFLEPECRVEVHCDNVGQLSERVVDRMKVARQLTLSDNLFELATNPIYFAHNGRRIQ
jgi:hypothetical protein